MTLGRTLLVAWLVSSLGCTNTATLSTHRGPIEAKITGGDADNLFVVTGSGAGLEVPRREITDIDHPGNVLAVVGGILAFTGIVDSVTFATASAFGCKGSALGACVATGALAVAGATMFVWGLLTWLWSKAAVVPQPAVELAPPLPPPLLVPPPVQEPVTPAPTTPL